MAEKPTSAHPAPASPAKSPGAPPSHEAAPAKGPAKASTTAKKKKVAKKAKVSLTAKAKEWLKVLRGYLTEIARGIRSPDAPTRRMSVFFFVSLAGVLALASWNAQRMFHERSERKAAELAVQRETEARLLAERQEGSLEKEAEESKKHVSMLDLGDFTITLKPLPGQKAAHGMVNMAELDLVVECDTPETHAYIEENMVQVRNQITDVFVTYDRGELLTREGKHILKKKLLERINGWLPKGKVQNIFFSKLVVA